MRTYYIFHPLPEDEPIDEPVNRMFTDEEVEQLMKEMEEFDNLKIRNDEKSNIRRGAERP